MMADPTLTRGELAERLRIARLPEAQDIARQLDRRRFVGLEGEAGVGKTVLLHWVSALLALDRRLRPAHVDLDGAWGIGRTAWLLGCAAGQALAGPAAWSQLRAGFDDVLLSSQGRRARFELHQLLGDKFADDVVRGETTDDDRARIDTAIAAFGHISDVALVIDHLEAPGLSVRHPLDVEQLLWQVRGVHQQTPSMHLCVCSRPHAAEAARADTAAFYEDGVWLSIGAPDRATWATVVTDAWGNTDVRRLDEILQITRGQPANTLALVAQPHTLSVSEAATRVGEDLADAADRAAQHARSLHRLGVHLLVAIARRQRPYSAVPGGRAEVPRALAALRAAGLITKHGRGEWRLTDPLLARGLIGEDGVGGAIEELDMRPVPVAHLGPDGPAPRDLPEAALRVLAERPDDIWRADQVLAALPDDWPTGTVQQVNDALRHLVLTRQVWPAGSAAYRLTPPL
jgi:hypothetical protein